VDDVVATSDLPAGVVSALHLGNAAAAPAATTAAASPAGAPALAGAVVPLRASGCGACAVGSTDRSEADLALAVTAILFVAFGARRRTTP
jgi:MYXO-CTERM domain-containing protein